MSTPYMQVNPLTGELEVAQGPVQPMGGDSSSSSSSDGSSDGGGIDTADLLRRLAATTGGMAAANRNQNNIVDSHNLTAYAQSEAAKLARDKFATAAPGQRLKDSTMASVESNFTPTRVSWGGPGSGLKGQLPVWSGGAAGAMANLDPRTKDLASTVMNDDLAMQRAGGETGGKRDRYTSPAPVPGQESIVDKLLGGTAAGSSLLSSLLGPGGSKGGMDLGALYNSIFHHGQINPTSTTYSTSDGSLPEGPTQDQYFGDDATYEPGGYNFSGPMWPEEPPNGGGTSDGGDEWNP